jgi:FkbM family methyltransferase
MKINDMIDVIKTPDGTVFAGYPNDHLFSEISNGHVFVDWYVKDAIDRYVKPDSICVDVGANLGYVSLYMAQRSHFVYAFEPQFVVYLQLCANIFLNQRFNIKPHHMGLYSKETMLDFGDYQDGWVGTKDFSDYTKIKSIGSISFQPKISGSVQAKRLDDVIHSRVDFIKIDAQGADIDVLYGAKETLRKYHPIVIFEYESDFSTKNYGRTLDDVKPLVNELGYKMVEVFTGNFLLT